MSYSYHKKRTDANQAEIVQDLRKAGCSVALTHALGGGFPDLVVGYFDRQGVSRNVLLEVKLPGEKLNKREKAWHEEWLGPVFVVESSKQVLEIIGRIEV